MRKHIIVNTVSGSVGQIVEWGDDRDFPSNWELAENEEVVTVDAGVDVDVYCVYDCLSKGFYMLDVEDNDLKLAQLKYELAEYENVLSDFQEATWQGLGVIESNLPQEWQDRLTYKRSLRTQIAELEVSINE